MERGEEDEKKRGRWIILSGKGVCGCKKEREEKERLRERERSS